MIAQYGYPSHYLPPTTPPQSAYLDRASIVHSQPEVTDLSYDETDMHAASCSHFPPPLSSSSHISLPPLVQPPALVMPSPYAESSRHSRLRSSVDISTPALVADEEEFSSRGKMDMNMAATGSLAASPGIQTPLATYAAEMVVWLWFGSHKPSPHRYQTPTDPFSRHHSPTTQLNPLQVSPSPYFSAYVAKILQITMVSHSVVLIALLYIYRLKTVHEIRAEAGSEQRPFVASLILSNKYLDDNTYTNATWAELAGLTLAEVNRMEAEFLRGIDYQLSVKKGDYEQWRTLLDGAIFARQREAAQMASLTSRVKSQWSPQTVIYTPSQPSIPTLPEPLVYRARSASPQVYSPPYALHPEYTYTFPASPVQRKRTAVDAFSSDIPGSSVIYEQMRLPTRKAGFNGTIDVSQAQSQLAQLPPSSSLGRSSSLSRQIARMPAQGGRRGSMGHVYGLPSPTDPDLRHSAVMGWSNENHPEQPSSSWNGYRALVAPYERPETQVIPPEHLMFYSLAAEAHPGQDGAPRKAILRYQEPAQYQVSSAHSDAVYQYNYGAVQPALPQSSQLYYGYAEPEPAQFANAGPPGYAYDPSMISHFHRDQNVAGRGLGIQGIEGLDEWRAAQETRARSQWSSPMPGGYDFASWQQ